MMDPQAMVEEFHRKFDIAVSDRPSLPEEATRQLRVRLIQEEFEELQEAMVAQDLPGVAKELADLLYVVYGTAVSYGLDMDPVFREVHRSNLSKVGGYKRADGKGYALDCMADLLREWTLAEVCLQSGGSTALAIRISPR